MLDDQSATFLLVEDNAGHARLIEKNLRRANISNNVLVFEDGQEVVNYLYDEMILAEISSSPPLLVLLDLNLPVLSGYQVLEKVKSDERTKHIPVVVLTTTEDPQEIAKCYELGCNIYVTKPVEYDQFCEAIHKLGMFLSIIKIPERDEYLGGRQ